MQILDKAHLGYLHRRERMILKKINSLDDDAKKISFKAKRLRKKAREVIFLA
jgi:hypothetical protein